MKALDSTMAALIESVVNETVRRTKEELRSELADTGFLDVAGAAEFLACGKDRIYALCSAGRIPHYKDGSRTLFDRAELREYVRDGGALRP